MKKTILALAIILILSSLPYGVPMAKAALAKKNIKSQKSQLVYPYFLKRNPFQTFLYTKKPTTSFKVGEIPLLQYSLSSLKIIGIMERRGKYFAMIQTPDNRSYIITVGSIIGIGRARVVSIKGNRINLVESTYNALGQMHTVSVVMTMR